MSQRPSDELCVLMSSVPLSMFLFLSEVVLTYKKRIKDLLCSFVVRHLAISAKCQLLLLLSLTEQR